jgi:GxxExxY protein
MTKYDLAGQVIGCAMEVHSELGYGLSESVYQKSLAIELAANGFEVIVEKQIKVFYKGHDVGHFAADLFVNEKLIIELKAVQHILKEHEAQLVNYLSATNTEEGLLINFGAPSLQFKKKYKTYKAANS